MATLLVLAATLLAACGAGQPTATPEAASASESYVSAHLPTSYEGALGVSGQLALGTMKLENTADAVSTEQAATLLPLWQALRSEALQDVDEMNAVLRQIESTMDARQLEAIAAMQLTREDLLAWTQEQGLSLGSGEVPGPLGEGQVSPEARATRQAQSGGQAPAAEAMATLRARIESMSDEERQALRATAQAGGQALGARGAAGRFLAAAGELRAVYNPLIEMLTARAAQ